MVWIDQYRIPNILLISGLRQKSTHCLDPVQMMPLVWDRGMTLNAAGLKAFWSGLRLAEL